MYLAIPLAFELGIRVGLVDGLPFEICQPRLNVSGWDEDRHPFIPLTPLAARFDAGAFNLLDSGGNVSPIGIYQHNQRLLNPVLSCPVIGKFLYEPLPHELLARPAAFRIDLDPLHPDVSAGARQDPTGKCLVLPVFTQDNNLDISAHGSHPLAKTSDSFRPPSTAISLAGRTVVAPEFSRLKTSPLSPPR